MQDWRRKWSFFENKMFHQNKVKKFFKKIAPKSLREYQRKIKDNSYYCQNNFYSFLQKGKRITLRYSKKVLSLQTYDFKFRHYWSLNVLLSSSMLKADWTRSFVWLRSFRKNENSEKGFNKSVTSMGWIQELKGNSINVIIR